MVNRGLESALRPVLLFVNAFINFDVIDRANRKAWTNHRFGNSAARQTLYKHLDRFPARARFVAFAFLCVVSQYFINHNRHSVGRINVNNAPTLSDRQLASCGRKCCSHLKRCLLIVLQSSARVAILDIGARQPDAPLQIYSCAT
jgi:hypothetical protein